MIIPDTYTLTEAGWPRPLYRGQPVPWVAPQENLGEVNDGRRLASVGGGICQVCGLGFAHGEEAFGFTTTSFNGVDVPRKHVPLDDGDALSEIMHPDTRVILLDGAVMHPRCCRLTAARCPHVRDNPYLLCVSVMANDADPIELDGLLRPSYAANQVQLAPWPIPGRPE